MDCKALHCRKAIFLRSNTEYYCVVFDFFNHWNLFTLHLNRLPFKVDTGL